MLFLASLALINMCMRAEPSADTESDVLDLVVHLLAKTVEGLEGPQGTGPLEADIQLLKVQSTDLAPVCSAVHHAS